MATRSIVVRNAQGEIVGNVDTTHCSWCTDEHVCCACHVQAERLRTAGASKKWRKDQKGIWRGKAERREA